MKKIVLLIKRNPLAVLMILFACIGVLVFASLGSVRHSNQRNNTTVNFLPSTSTSVLVPAQGWWMNVSTPTPLSEPTP